MAPRTGVRFERVELEYGRHSGAFDLIRADERPVSGSTNGSRSRSGNGKRAARGRPFVILGPNGAGKTTLVEAAVRALYGFRRTTRLGRETHDRRRPWVGGPYRARLFLRTGVIRYALERDFETDFVRVLREGREDPVFEDEANPARSSEKARRYRGLLREMVGLPELDGYRKTAWISQGGILETGISVDLLRVAAGGHTDVESAQKRLKKEYAVLSKEPIAPGESKRRTPGRVERLDAEIAELEAELARARSLEERRAPLVRSRDECIDRLEAVVAETDRLDAAFETLTEAQRLQTEIDAARGRIRGLERAARDLDEALARLDLLERQASSAPARYPADFAERARLLEEGLWPRVADIASERARLDEEEAAGTDARVPPSALVAGGLVAMVAGVLVWLRGAALPGLALLAAGAAAQGLGLVLRGSAADRAAFRARRRAELDGERRAVDERIRVLLTDVPGGERLGPDGLAAARREYEREAADRRHLDEAEASLRHAVDAAGRDLELEGSEEGPAERGGGRVGLVERARERLGALHAAVGRERDERLAPRMLELREFTRTRLELPPDVEPTLDAVRAARRERLAESRRLQKELARIEGDLAAEGRVPASALTLERELRERTGRRRAAAERASACRHGFRLLAEAYDAFRTTDEARLLGAISGHLRSLTGGRLGPIEAEGGLDEAKVRAGERSLELASPPLSYGQWHAALLSVRLGASDFLAGLGVPLPLIVDDPFVHLDERGVTDLWDVLSRVAGERQVIVATQDRLVLEHLDVAPDIELAPPVADAPDARPEETVSPATPDTPAREGREDEAGRSRLADPVLDLWDDVDGS